MIDDKKLVVTISPHIKDKETTSLIMWTVTATLLPSLIMGTYYFGLKATFIVFMAIVSSVSSEYLYQKFMNKKITVSDGSAFLTGLLLGLNLPPSIPFYIPVIGSSFAIIVAKQLFGGLGYNIFNPALIGRAFLLASFPRLMTTWTQPVAFLTQIDAKTTATPLSILKESGESKLIEIFGSKLDLYSQLLIGNRSGCIGETSIIALLLGATYLFYKKYITWHIPISYILTAGILAWIFGNPSQLFGGDPILHILSGGMIIGAFYMATDYVTSPALKKGQILFGIGCGFLTMLIRLKGGYPEGVMFAILIMNCFSPLIDRSFKTKVFGTDAKK